MGVKVAVAPQTRGRKRIPHNRTKVETMSTGVAAPLQIGTIVGVNERMLPRDLALQGVPGKHHTIHW